MASKRNFSRSLRLEIIILMIVVGILPCIAAYLGIIGAYESRAIELSTSELENQSLVLISHINENDYLNNPTSETVNAKLVQLAGIYKGRGVVLDSLQNIVMDTEDSYDLSSLNMDLINRSLQGEHISEFDRTSGFIHVISPIFQSDNTTISGVLLVSASTEPITQSIEMFRFRGSVILLSAFILVLLISVLASYLIVKPIRKITTSIQEVSEGYEEHLLHVDTYWETKLLSQEFNKMLGRLKLIDDSRQEFVSNVSHELKTPLTSMKVLAESLLSMEEVPVDIYREFMDDIAKEIDRENDIINDLLTLVKTDRRSTSLTLTHVNVNELIEGVLKRLQPIADKNRITLELQQQPPIIAEIDQVKMTLAITNLVENGIKYNHPDGNVEINLNQDSKNFYIQVKDSGMGIALDDQPYIFERFFRVDKSHSKEIEGTGLGLSITHNAVIIHHGTIKIHSEEGKGSTFIITLPLRQS